MTHIKILIKERKDETSKNCERSIIKKKKSHAQEKRH